MTLTTYLQFAVSLVFVLALIGVAAVVGRRFAPGLGLAAGKSRRRLAIAEVLPLDGKRRLVLLSRDGVEHLVVLGPTSETVIEVGISRPDGFEQVLARRTAPAAAVPATEVTG